MGVESEDNRIPLDQVVKMWFDGFSASRIAQHFFLLDNKAIEYRIKRAKELYPELPWSERKPRHITEIGAVNWNRLRDGKPGSREASGSIVPGRDLR